jgi:heme-degrading monooxygenase HmoA
MYVTIRAYQGNSGLADALVERESDVRRIIGEIDGFRAYYLLKLAEGTTTVSVFDSQAGAEESTRVAAAWLADNLPEMGATPYVTAGEAVLTF